jgi:hypothetical protein
MRILTRGSVLLASICLITATALGQQSKGFGEPQPVSADLTPKAFGPLTAEGSHSERRHAPNVSPLRRGWDSNPRCLTARQLIRPLHSATLPPLEKDPPGWVFLQKWHQLCYGEPHQTSSTDQPADRKCLRSSASVSHPRRNVSPQGYWIGTALISRMGVPSSMSTPQTCRSLFSSHGQAA